MNNIISQGEGLKRGQYSGLVKKRVHIPGAVFNETEYLIGPTEMGLHYHENPHITLVFQGGDIEARGGDSYERRSGDIFFYHAGEKHQTLFRNKYSRNLNIELEMQLLEEQELCEEQLSKSINCNLNSKFITMRMLQEVMIEDHVSKISLESLLYELIGTSKKSSPMEAPCWVKDLKEVLNDRWNEQISLEELSKIVGVHRVTISKFFSKYFLCSYGEYMRRLKINRSLSLIRASEMSLTEIAVSCGFVDQSHFIKNFKAFTGFLPNRYRKL